jgi:TolA-binding protein
MRITAIAVAGLVASTLVTASAAPAEVTAQPALSHFYPLQPPTSPSPQSDPRSEVQELQRQISELHDSWDNLTPEQRNQRIAQLQQQVTTVDKDTQNLPPDQRAGVEAPLLSSAIELADLLGKAQSSAPQPCVLFFGPPPCGI